MATELKGTVNQIFKTESGVGKSGKEWQKREFVIVTNEQFPKTVCFTLLGDKISLLDKVSIGSEVSVLFNLESREFNGKWFHSVNAWKIDIEAGQGTTGGGNFETGLIQLPPTEPEQPEDDSLPF